MPQGGEARDDRVGLVTAIYESGLWPGSGIDANRDSETTATTSCLLCVRSPSGLLLGLLGE